MGSINVNWDEAGISNDFLFGKIMRDPEICKEMLATILPELDIDYLEYPEVQKSIDMDKDARSVRLDVYVKDNKDIVYNIEMQIMDPGNMPERSRYYQSMLDLQLIEKGEAYEKLNRSYIIFICPFDLFQKGRHMYTFEYLCKEDSSIRLEDGTTKIFLNAKGSLNDIRRELKAFLNYVVGEKSEDSFVKKLEAVVEEAKKNREWRHEYMTLLMRDQENIEKGRKEGRKIGKIEGLFQSLDNLIKNNPTLDVITAAGMLGFSNEELEEYKKRQ